MLCVHALLAQLVGKFIALVSLCARSRVHTRTQAMIVGETSRLYPRFGKRKVTGSYFQRPRQVLDRLFRLVLPTLDNLRNFLLTPTTEVLNFLQILWAQ